ncbi:MAG: universal stress protein [Anaerolineae bacterium]|nr:universal stress protein [Anaerolineae bacterium]
MLNQVLVPLDGSKLAEEALQHALNILAPGGKIILLSAVDVPEVPMYGYYPPTTVPDYEAAKEELLPQAKTYLENIAKHLGKDDVQVVLEAQIGEPAHVITEVAVKFHVDAIVMSTHGRSGLGRWLFGSVTQKVLSAKPCPVYVIPSGGSDKPESA